MHVKPKGPRHLLHHALVPAVKRSLVVSLNLLENSFTKELIYEKAIS